MVATDKKKENKVSAELIKIIVERHSNYKDISLKTRERPYPYLRCIYYVLCKKFCTKKTSLSQIGNILNLDHATVLHGLKRFYEYENQEWFKEFYEIYIDCCKEIRETIKNLPEFDLVKDIEEVKRDYRVNFIQYQEKNREIVNKLVIKLDNLRHRPIFKEIASLDDETLDLFEERAKAFLIMNNNK